MVEVRLWVGKGANRLLKTSYAPTFFEIEGVFAQKKGKVAALVSSSRLYEVQNEQRAAQGFFDRQTRQGTPQERMGMENSSCSKNSDSGPYVLKVELASETESLSDPVFQNVVDSESKALCNFSERSVSRFARYTAQARIHVAPNMISSWRKNGNITLIPTMLDHTRCDYRSFCTVRTVNGLSTFRLRQSHAEVVSRDYSGTARNDNSQEPLYKTKSAYYEILEVSPSATHTQIKTAYYKQSFIYHPDKNKGSEEATHRFSQISEAYNVLGNRSLRRKYDHGILSATDLHGARRPSTKEPTSSVTSGQQARTRDSPSVGVDSKNMFDFDSFIRSHYGEQLQRDKDLRSRREEMERKKEETYQDWKMGRMTEMAVGMLLAMAVAIVFSLKS